MTKPTLRNTTVIDIRQKVYEAVHAELQSERYPFQSCINCVFFTDSEQCSLFKQRPPAKIIVYGCEKFEDMEVIPY